MSEIVASSQTFYDHLVPFPLPNHPHLKASELRRQLIFYHDKAKSRQARVSSRARMH